MSLFLFFTAFTFLFSAFLGLALILRPAEAIELQKQFYLIINWRIEPVNMALEIRNTRIMGFMIIAVVIACIVYTIIFAGGKFRI